MKAVRDHVAWITKGKPVEVGQDKMGEPKFSARYHFVCTCGEAGGDEVVRAAQAQALLHQGGEAQTVAWPKGRTEDDVAVHFALECGHNPTYKTEYPARFLKLTEAFCDTCRKFTRVKSAEKVKTNR